MCHSPGCPICQMRGRKRTRNPRIEPRTLQHVKPNSTINLYTNLDLFFTNHGPDPCPDAYSGCSATGTFFVRTNGILAAQIGQKFVRTTPPTSKGTFRGPPSI